MGRWCSREKTSSSELESNSVRQEGRGLGICNLVIVGDLP